MKKIVSALLTMVLLFTSFTVMPVTSVLAEEETELHHSLNMYDEHGQKINDYVSDPEEINGWKDYFEPTTEGNAIEFSTEYAGAVWTDKSVFDKEVLEESNPFDTLKEMVIKKDNGSVVIENGNILMVEGESNEVTVQDGNFLVSLSALAATKEIVGYSNLPSDSVIILDLSNSMEAEEMNAMVEATNKAIDKLYSLNNYNRVGIAVYATDAYELLPLDRYETSKTLQDVSGDEYKVYIELENFKSFGGANTGTLRVAMTDSQVYTSDFSNVNWNQMNYEISSVRNNYDYYNNVASILEKHLKSSIPTGITVNWNSVARGKTRDNWQTYITNTLGTFEVSLDNPTYFVKDSAGNDVKKSISVGGGTYIQGGLKIALDMFKEVDNKVIPSGYIQGGTKRIPIVVLMSDGAPTYGSTNYTNPNATSYNIGGGSNTTDQLVFPTQLTAAFLKKTLESKEYYDNDSLFYTLGLDVGNSGEALRVLNPEYNTNSTIDNYWKDYQNTATNSKLSTYSSITKAEKDNDSLYDENHNYRYYADKYFSATNAADLLVAFNSIVETIVIQSKYYPTLVESGENNLDGYITFDDELGHFMKVKDVKGLVWGDDIFTGKAFIDAMNTSGVFGDRNNWTEYGAELMDSISERLNITENQARELLSAAWNTPTQLKVIRDDQNNIISVNNYIGWYSNEDGEYLAHWNDAEHTSVNYPAQARYLNKCYVFQGTLNNTYGNIEGSDMMHIVVQIHEDITTEDQSVTWKIPASLIPLFTYHVDIDADKISDAKNIYLSYESNNPIRLLYEVALDEKINSVNLREIVGAEGEHNHPVTHNEEVVGYAFYSNRWGAGYILNGDGVTDVFDPGHHLATVSHFHPSKANERYYYTENDLIYTDSEGKNVYRGSHPAEASGEFYHFYDMFIATEALGDGKYKAKLDETKYIPIDQKVLETAIATSEGDSNSTWYIPAGQIYQQIARHQVKKDDKTTLEANDGNFTGTLEYYDYPVIAHPNSNSNADEYHIYDFLGNNGRLVMYSAQGIKLTKTIDDRTKTESFHFTVSLTNPAPDVSVTDANGNPIDASSGKWSKNEDNTMISVEVKNDETVYIIGIPEDINYKITEVTEDSMYKVLSVNGNQSATTAEGTIKAFTIDNVHFENTLKGYGDLVISKEIVHEHGDPISETETFEMTVTLKVGDNPVANKEFVLTGTGMVNDVALESGNLYKTDANGQFKIQLGHDDSIMIAHIEDNVSYTVVETIPSGKSYYTANNNGTFSGNIVKNATQNVEVVNTYKPNAAVANVTLSGKKTLNGRDWQEGDVFTFQLQKLENGNWVNVENATDKVSYGDEDKDYTINSELSFSKIGTYTFRLIEVVPTNKLKSMIYDRTAYLFTVTVSDANKSGQLIANVTYNGSAVENSTIPNLDFTNQFNSASVVVSLKKNLTNNTGIPFNLSNFKFGVYTDSSCQTEYLYNPNNNPNDNIQDNPFKTGVGGEANYKFSYTESDAESIVAGENKDFIYYVKEIDESYPGIKYDLAIYEVHIKLAKGTDNNLSANLESITKITEEGTSAASSIVFENEYELVKTNYKLNAEKQMDGRAIRENDDFTFNLYQTGANFVVSENPIKTYTTDGGEMKEPFSFDLSFESAGTYYYVIKEVHGDNQSVKYDDSIYHVTVVVGNDDNDEKLDVNSVTINKVGLGVVDDVIFNNEYHIVQKASAKISGNKTLNGKSIKKDEFEFGLYKDASFTECIETVSAAELSGAFSFTEISYDNAGVYEYYVREEVSDTEYEGTMTYDKSVYKVTINVSDKNNNGVLVAEQPVIVKVRDDKGNAVNNSVEEISFVNTYTYKATGPIDIEALKFFKDEYGNSQTNWPTFTFELYPADKDFKITGEKINLSTDKDTVTSSSDSGIKFTQYYDRPGTHYYVLREVEGDLPAIGYDQNEYHIMVVASDYESSGKLLVSKTITRNGLPVDDKENPLTFTNRFFEMTAEVEINIEKKFDNESGIEIPLSSFGFGLYTKDDQDNYVPYLIGEEHVIAYADDDGRATLEFVIDNDGMTQGQIGTRKFYVKELIPDNPEYAITYDERAFEVVVNLEYTKNEDSEYELSSEVVYPTNAVGEATTQSEGNEPESIIFTNLFELENTVYVLNGNKVLSGRNWISNDKFGFEVYKANVSTNSSQEEVWEKVGEATLVMSEDTDNDGKSDEIEFEFNLDEVGTSYYIIKEKDDNKYGITYDDSEYRVAITTKASDANNDNQKDTVVVDRVAINKVVYVDGNPTVTPVNSSILSFNNIYKDSTEVEINIQKILNFTSDGKHGLSGFVFELKGDSDSAVATSGADGKAEFILQFDERHVDKSFKFVVSEADQKEKDMVYDTTKHEIELEVKVNSEGKLIVAKKDSEVAVSKIDLTFTNTFNGSEDVPEKPVDPTPTVVVPNTGDDSNIFLYGAMMLICVLLMAILFVLEKKRELAARR